MTFQNSPFSFGDKVVAYCRYSEGDEQGLKNQSTEEQAEAIRQFCDANGLELVRVFADPFASGRSVAKRDHYLEMLSYLLHKKKPDVQGVVLWDFERYGRNYDQAQLDAARLRMAGYKLFSLQQPITDNGPFAHVLEAMYFASAQNQSDMISADVKRALQNNFVKYKVIPRSCIPDGWVAVPVDMGVYSDGTPRTGYKAEPDPEKAKVIRQAVETRLNGGSLSDCRQILGIDNYLIRRLFAKPLLYGAMTYGGTTIEDYCTPIIDRQTYDALQTFERSAVKKQIGRQGGWSKNPPMLSGLLYCAHCGAPMYINRRKSKGRVYCTYRCKNSCMPGVRQDVLDPFIIEQCMTILTDDNVRQWVSAMPIMTDDEPDPEAETTLADIMRRIDNITDLIADRPSEALLLKLSDLEAQRDAIRSKLTPNNAPDASNAESLYKSTLDLTNAIKRVLASSADDTTKKTALSTFVRSILVASDGLVVINYCTPGTVVTQTGQNRTAPPEGVPFGSQQGYIDLSPRWFHPSTASSVGVSSSSSSNAA